MASWTQNGEALDLLDTGSEDLTHTMDLFSRISATSARFYLPVNLKPGETPEYIRTQLLYTCAMMMGRIPIVEDTYSEEEKGEARSQDFCDDYAEMILQRKGAEIARDKLDVMTRQGREPLTPQGWYDFIHVWLPHFETLWPKFRGNQHYVEDDPWESIGE